MTQVSGTASDIVLLKWDTHSVRSDLRAQWSAHRVKIYDRTSANLVVDRISEAALRAVNKVNIMAEVLREDAFFAFALTGAEKVDEKVCKARDIAVHIFGTMDHRGS